MVHKWCKIHDWMVLKVLAHGTCLMAIHIHGGVSCERVRRHEDEECEGLGKCAVSRVEKMHQYIQHFQEKERSVWQDLTKLIEYYQCAKKYQNKLYKFC